MLPPKGWRQDVDDFIDVVWHQPRKGNPMMGKNEDPVVFNAPTVANYVIKDSGERKVFDSGMQRDVTAGKLDYSLVLDGPMFKRWADHMQKGAIKYDKRNWMKATGKEEYDRFKESALRHFMQWYYGEEDEDHASAVFFNINGVEYLKEKGEIQ